MNNGERKGMQADGLVLAGGKSRRMGGEHKGNLVYQPKFKNHSSTMDLS